MELSTKQVLFQRTSAEVYEFKGSCTLNVTSDIDIVVFLGGRSSSNYWKIDNYSHANYISIMGGEGGAYFPSPYTAYTTCVIYSPSVNSAFLGNHTWTAVTDSNAPGKLYVFKK